MHSISNSSLPRQHPAQPRYPVVLSIAGSDCSGGAGIQADLKTFAALGCYGMSAITALTAQNTQGVRAILGVPASFVQEQIAAVLDDIEVDAVKIGMLHTAEVVEVVAWAIDTYRIKRVVLDPVMVASSGDALIEPATLAVLVRELFPRATLVTPNLDEAALLLGRAVHSSADLGGACAELLALGARAVLLKGGHLDGEQLTDVLARADIPATGWLHLNAARIASRNVHGTGCTLAAAIAAQLALGHTLTDAVRSAHGYIRAAIAAGAKVVTGHGIGPLNHGHAPIPMRLLG